MPCVVHERRKYRSSSLTAMLSIYYLSRTVLRPRCQKEFQPCNNPHHGLERLAVEGDFSMLGEVSRRLNTQELIQALSMTGLPNRLTGSVKKRGVKNIFLLLGFGTSVKPGFRPSNAFLCSGYQCYALYFKFEQRRKYPCSACV